MTKRQHWSRRSNLRRGDGEVSRGIEENQDKMQRFDGKVAIVTGAARGIGEAYAKALAREGARVVVADLDDEGARKVVAEIEADGGEATFVPVDVSDEASTKAMAEATVERYGGIDHLVNNAAIYGGMKLDILLTVDWDYYQRFMSVNLDGALLCARACWTSDEERGGGSIVNQSSTAAWMYAGYLRPREGRYQRSDPAARTRAR